MWCCPRAGGEWVRVLIVNDLHLFGKSLEDQAQRKGFGCEDGLDGLNGYTGGLSELRIGDGLTG